MSTLVPRLLPSFQSLALCTANDGKLDRAWGTRLVISDSAAHTCRKQHGLCHSKEWPSRKKRNAENPNATFCQ